MGWTQPCCEACWVRRHVMSEGSTLMLRMPHRVRAASVETCCYCGAITIVGIFVRQDPERVAYPSVDDEKESTT